MRKQWIWSYSLFNFSTLLFIHILISAILASIEDELSSYLLCRLEYHWHNNDVKCYLFDVYLVMFYHWLKHTEWVLSARYNFTQIKSFPMMPKEYLKYFSSIGWSITSKAANKSSIINTVMDPLSKASAMSLCTIKRTVSLNDLYKQT